MKKKITKNTPVFPTLPLIIEADHDPKLGWVIHVKQEAVPTLPHKLPDVSGIMSLSNLIRLVSTICINKWPGHLFAIASCTITGKEDDGVILDTFQRLFSAHNSQKSNS